MVVAEYSQKTSSTATHTHTHLFPNMPLLLLDRSEGDLDPLATHAYATDPNAEAVMTATMVR